MSELIRILIADDHYVVRQGLATLLVPRNGMEVVGAAATGTEAVALARTLQPDVILMDLIMPADGWHGGHRLHQAGEPRRPHPGLDQLRRARAGGGCRAGRRIGLPAQGLLARRPAVRHSQRLPRQPLYPPRSGQGTDAGARAPPACRRQRSVHGARAGSAAAAGARAAPTATIGEALFISPTTVRAHVSNILLKLHVANRTQAAVAAQERSLV